MSSSESMGTISRTTRARVVVEIADVPARSRFEATIAGEPAAFAEYRVRAEQIDFVHTVTEPDWGGRGVASALADGALELVAAAGRRVIPRCPFIGSYIHARPALADLVDDRYRYLIRARPR